MKSLIPILGVMSCAVLGVILGLYSIKATMWQFYVIMIPYCVAQAMATGYLTNRR